MATSLHAHGARATGDTARRLALVLNDKAGAVLAGAVTPDQLRARLQHAGATVLEPPPGRLPDRLREAAASADTVVVAGGDGTVACAAAALAGSHAALGILPCGTMNLLARDLHLPLQDSQAAAAVILAGETRRIDVGRVAGHPFLCACMLGSAVRLGRHREQARRHGPIGQWLQLARAAVLVLRRPRRQRLTLLVDGLPHHVRTRSLTITLGALDDHTGRMFGRARLDAGLLCVYVVRRPGVLDLLRVLWRLASGKPHDRALSVYTGTAISVSAASQQVHVMVDGEVMLLESPVHFTVQPRALTVLAPGGTA